MKLYYQQSIIMKHTLHETMKWTVTVIQLHKQTGNETILICKERDNENTHA